MRIPRRIIQTGKTKALSPSAKAATTNIKLLHPEWDYIYMDDADVVRFVKAEFPEYEDVFYGFPHTIQRIDFFRYLAVFKLGGFYFDLDVFLYEQLSALLDKGCVFPFEELTLNPYFIEKCGIDWEIGNYAFGAAAGHPFLGAIIENCARAQRDPDWRRPMMEKIPPLFRAEFEVLNTTGPGLLTRTLAENPIATADMAVLFPADVCDSAFWHQFGNYGVHKMDGSWRTGGNVLRRRILCWWEERMRRRTMPMSRHIGPKRSIPRSGYRDGEAGIVDGILGRAAELAR